MRNLKSIVFPLSAAACFLACDYKTDVGPLSLATIDVEGRAMPSLNIPAVIVEASDINLVKDEFNHFTIVNEEFLYNGEPQTYRIKEGEGNFTFANGGNLTIRVGELESYGYSSEDNSKDLSNVYELIDWNNSMHMQEGGLTANIALNDYPESNNLGFENLILVQNGEESYGYIIRYELEDNADERHDLSDYAGKMMVKDLKGNTTKEFNFKNGMISTRKKTDGHTLSDCYIEYTKVITPFEEYITVEISFSGVV